jgi:flavocytochrome c
MSKVDPRRPIIIVGGGLAGLSAAHQAYMRGANVLLIDKQGFLSGNSGKATSGINGALTRPQVDLSIRDSVQQFYQDTLKTAKDRANPQLIKVLTYNSADAVHWLQDEFGLDLSVISRLGGHSQPRTHRGKDSKFPGMAITYKLLETLEELAETEPDRVKIYKSCQVVDLLTDPNDKKKVLGVEYKNLHDKSKSKLYGPVIMATGGYAADFTKNSLLRKYRPDIIDLPSTNGTHATGDGQKIIMKNLGVGIDLDKVQVHPTGLLDLDDKDAISGKVNRRFLFLGAEALRGEGGIMLNSKGERFVDELGTRDYVSGEMEKQVKLGNGPIRLILNEAAEKNLEFHIKHYKMRNLMKTLTGKELLSELGITEEKLEAQFETYNRAAKGETRDSFGKKFFPNAPFEYDASSNYHVSYVTRVLHFTMGGVKINDKSQVLFQDETPFEGLYAAGEVAGGVHGHNRLGGSSLLACVVYGRLAAAEACLYTLHKLTNETESTITGPQSRLSMINLHIDPNNKQIIIDFGDNDVSGSQKMISDTNQPSGSIQEESASATSAAPSSASAAKPKFVIPDKEFTLEEVAKHNTKDDCWCIIRNVVLDLTKFMSHHPGGEHSILNFAGKDATESFEMLHQDSFIPKYTPSCVLGLVKGTKPGLEI